MQRGHLNGSCIIIEFSEPRYSATLGRAQGHNFKGGDKVHAVEGSDCTIKWQTEKKASSHSITHVFLTALHSILSSDSASEAPLYLEFEHKATDPKNVPTLSCPAEYPDIGSSSQAFSAHFF